MINNSSKEDFSNPAQLSHSVSLQAINLPRLPIPKSYSSPLPSNGGHTLSAAFKMENCCIDISPGGSNKCGEPLPTETAAAFNSLSRNENLDSVSLHSVESFVCRICHNCENPENLVSPCLCKGSLTYVHIHCLERWISTSRCTSCELCQFQYNTQQTLRYSIFESLRIWYSRSMSRRALQEDCQMFSLLTLVSFGIIGTLLVTVQYVIFQGHVGDIGRLWTKGWLIFFLFTTLVVYLANVYLIAKTQLTPWYRWWQSARDIRLILENRKPFPSSSQLAKRQMQRQHQQSSAMYQTTSSSADAAAQMPMDQTAKNTSSQMANDTTQCPDVIVQTSLPQDTDTTMSSHEAATTTAAAIADAAYNDRTNKSLIFLPINNYSNNPIGSNVLSTPYANANEWGWLGHDVTVADDNSNDGVLVVVTPPLTKYCNKNVSLHSQLKKCPLEKEDAPLTAAVNGKSMLTVTTAKGRRIFCGNATAISIALSIDVPLAVCGCAALD